MSDSLTYAICDSCNGMNRISIELQMGRSSVCGKCKRVLPLHGGVSDLTDLSLEILTRKSPLPVVVDFWAPWCGPCRAFSPTFANAALQLKGRIVFSKIDTQANPNGGQRFGVKGIPTLIVFLRGQELSRVSGALSLDEFMKWVTEAIAEPFPA